MVLETVLATTAAEAREALAASAAPWVVVSAAGIPWIDEHAATHLLADAPPIVVAGRTPDPAAAAGIAIDAPLGAADGRAVVARPDALRGVLAGAPAAAPFAEVVAAAYDSGADVMLDAHADLVYAADGTGTDVVWVGGRPIAAPTGSRPAIVAGTAPDPEPAEVHALFTYDGAALDSRAEAVVAGRELLVTPFWDRSLCRAVIAAAEASELWAPDPDDPVPGQEVSLRELCPPLLAHVEVHLDEIVVPAWRAVWPEFAWLGVHDAFVIKYVAGQGHELALHHDVAQISGAVRLNVGYSGGALAFPRQDFDNAEVGVGDLLAWPSLVTHPHRTEPLTRGVKYGLTIWTRLPD